MDDSAPSLACICERCPEERPSFAATVGPHCARFERWAACAQAAELVERGRYARLLEAAAAGSPHLPASKERQLMLDVNRTWPALSIFAEVGGRQKLSNVLRAWVIYDAEECHKEHWQEDERDLNAIAARFRSREDLAGKDDNEESQARERSGSGLCGSEAVGYVQGMNFLATALLWHSSTDEAAFWLFVAMVRRYGLRSMFEPPDMHGLKVRSFTIAQLVQQEMPDLSAHLAEHLQNSLSLLFTEWLLTLFSSSVPLVPLASLWDEFFNEGYTVIYRLILARLRCLKPWLLAETDFGSLVHLVKNAHIDFVGPDGQPQPRPARPGLPGHCKSAETAPSDESPAESHSVPQPLTSRRRGLLRRLTRAREMSTPPAESKAAAASSVSSPLSPSVLDTSDCSDDGGEGRQGVGARLPCPSCEGGGGELCSSWMTLVERLKAEVIDVARTAHYERMLAAPFHEPNAAGKAALHAKALEEENARLLQENAQLRRQLADARREVESTRRERAADRLRSRQVFAALLGHEFAHAAEPSD